jgi:hypothetical protein
MPDTKGGVHPLRVLVREGCLIGSSGREAMRNRDAQNVRLSFTKQELGHASPA